MPHATARSRPAAGALALALAACCCLAPRSAGAGAWDVYTDANALTSVAALEPYVWAPSLRGLHRFDPATGTFERYFREPKHLASNAVVAVTRDAAGVMWFGTAGAGVSLLYPSGAWQTLTAFEGLPSDSVTVLEPFDQGVWVGTRRGLAYYLGDELQAVWPDGITPSPFPSSYITDVRSAGGRTWVATRDGIFATADGVVWDTTVAGLTTRDARDLAHDSERPWAVTADGNVWRGEESGAWTLMRSGDAVSIDALLPGSAVIGAVDGVYVWDPAGPAWTPLGGPTRATIDLSTGFASGVWAGNAQGLWNLVGGTWQNFRSPGPSGNWIHGLALQGSTVYMTTRFDGASRYDDARGWRHFVGGGDTDTALYSSNFLFACFVDRDGFKWFGDWDGSLARLDDSGPAPQFTHFFPDTGKFTYAWSAGHDPQGPRWFGLDTGCRGCGPGFEPQGLIRIRDDGTRENYLPTNSAMTSQQVRAIAFASDGTMWVGYADFGVDVFADRTLAVRQAHLTVADGLRSDNVWGLATDGASVWVATDGGVARFTAGGAPQLAESFATPVISQNGAVGPLAVDAAGGVWLATASGLLHRAPGGTAELFTVTNSPLVSNDAHSVGIDRSTGDIWIGTGEGVNRLRPGQLGEPAGVSRELVVSPNPVSLGGGAVRFQARTGDGEPLVRTPIDLYDVGGRWVGRVRSDGQGLFTWDGTSRSGRQLDGGVYFLRALALAASGDWETRALGRLVLLP